MTNYPEYFPRRYNNGNTECDMLVGHCACGAYHDHESGLKLVSEVAEGFYCDYRAAEDRYMRTEGLYYALKEEKRTAQNLGAQS